MGKGFLYLVLLLGVFQKDYGAVADDVDDQLPSQVNDNKEPFVANIQNFYQNLSISLEDELHKKLVGIFIEIEKLEAQEEQQVADRAYLYQKELGNLKKKLAEVKNQKVKRKLEDECKQALVRIQKLLPKKDKKNPEAAQAAPKASLVLSPLPEDLEWYPEQHVYDHKGKPLKDCLCGLVSQFPKIVSPDRGFVLINNGLVKKLWLAGKEKQSKEKQSKEEQLSPEERLVQKIFNISPGGNVVPTALPANPVCGLSPLLVGQLIRMLITKDHMYCEAFKKTWKESYGSLDALSFKSPQNFNNNVNAFFKDLDAAYLENEQITIDVLLAYLYCLLEKEKTADKKAQVIQEYAQGLGIAYTPLYYTDQDFLDAKKFFESKNLNFDEDTSMLSVLVGRSRYEIENQLEALLFALKVTNPLKVFYFSPDQHVVYKNKDFGACAENTIRTLLSFVLCNPEMMLLDLKVLPATIVPSKELEVFVKEYGDFKRINFQKAEQAYLELVENKKGIDYIHKEIRYELRPTTENTVALLKNLFGIKDRLKGKPSDQFIALMNMLSTPEHKLTVRLSESQGSWSCKDTFSVIVTVPRQDFSMEGEFSFEPWHADCKLKFKADCLDEKSSYLIQALYRGSRYIDQFLLGIPDISPITMLAKLVDRDEIDTKEKLDTFFDKYTSKFYPDYKPVFLNPDLNAYKELFGYCDSRTNRYYRSYSVKTVERIEIYQVLIVWLKNLGVWKNDGLANPDLFFLVQDLLKNEDFLLVEQFLKQYTFPLAINPLVSYAHQTDAMMNSFLDATWSNMTILKNIVGEFFKKNRAISLYCADFFLQKKDDSMDNSNEVAVFKALIDAGMEIPITKISDFLEKIKEWQRRIMRHYSYLYRYEDMKTFLHTLEIKLNDDCLYLNALADLCS